MDLKSEGQPDVGMETLTWIHTHKTAALLKAAVAAGATLAGASDEARRRRRSTPAGGALAATQPWLVWRSVAAAVGQRSRCAVLARAHWCGVALPLTAPTAATC